jgi:hypothetical protein
MTHLSIARQFHWTYPDVLALPLPVYDVLVEALEQEQAAG